MIYDVIMIVLFALDFKSYSVTYQPFMLTLVVNTNKSFIAKVQFRSWNLKAALPYCFMQ